MFFKVLLTFSISISIQTFAMSVSFGELETVSFKSKVLGERKIHFFSLEDQIINKETTFIFFQDGQNLFDAETMWRNQEWEIDETFKKMHLKNLNTNIVVIAVNSANKSGNGFLDNTKRYAEYFPKQSISFFDKGFRKFAYKKFIDTYRFNYLNFLSEELIPLVEEKFKTKLNKNNTGIMGASMGGLISLNAMLEYPETFGFAGAFSTHWVGIQPLEYFVLPFRKRIEGDKLTTSAIKKYIESRVVNLENHKTYFDRGTQGLDAAYTNPQKEIDKIFSENNLSFKSLIFEGHDHLEKDWAKRFEKALIFLTN